MKRHAQILVLVLAFGLLVNIGVAWGCVLWSPMSASRSLDNGEAVANFRANLGSFERWGTPDGVEHAGLGWTIMLAQDIRLADGRPRAGRPVAGAGLAFKALPVMSPGSPNDKTLQVVRAGWPLRCLQGERTIIGGQSRLVSLVEPPRRVLALGVKPMRLLPLRPAWGRFALGLVFWAAVLWLLIPGPLYARRLVRRRRGRCPGCGYDVRGDFTQGCPECGVGRGQVA